MKFSVIIPCKTKADLCPELIPTLKSQTFKDFETIIVTDRLCAGLPAAKRDWGANRSHGQILAFIDSDAYPAKHWLKNALVHFKSPVAAAVCGPGLTPPTDSQTQQLSGLVWSTWLGAGGAGTFRNRQAKPRLVDDYPSFNLLVRKKDFNQVNGFNTCYWPGEDTKLCHDLVYILKKQILYHPQIMVYHHRRPVFISHLKQISAYGLHRGFFVKILPRTSLKPGYFIPLLFLFGLIILPSLTLPPYLFLLIITGLIHRSLLLIPAIFLTHLTYAVMFLKGLLTPYLKN